MSCLCSRAHPLCSLISYSFNTKNYLVLVLDFIVLDNLVLKYYNLDIALQFLTKFVFLTLKAYLSFHF